MDEDTIKRPKPELRKPVLMLDGERPCYAAFADAAQEKKILEILNEPRRKLAHKMLYVALA